MKKIFLFVLLTISGLPLWAQHEADFWYFGVMAGLSFNTSPPTVLTDGNTTTPEGTACISDSSGNLLFYTGGDGAFFTVFNSEHNPMPNGDSLFAGTSSTQAALIAKQPGNDSLYYVFTTDEIGGPFGFRYSIVDMSLQGGAGDVIEKNVFLESFVTEKLSAVTTYDGSKIWVVIHDWGSNAFYAYGLTAAGLDTDPIVSNVGTEHNTSVIQNTYGQMKFTSIGCRLGVAVSYQDIVEIFDFNMLNGTVSNPITIPMPDHVYGLEFSPDDSKLYVTCYDPMGTLVQFDLTQSNAADIIASATPLSITEDLYGLQLAPDGKIYIAKSYQPYLAIINQPNEQGMACDLVENGIYLDPAYQGTTSALGLPNFVQSYFDVFHKGCASIPTEIEEPLMADDVLVYPIPAKDFVFFNPASFSAAPIKVFITDITGKLCISTEVTALASAAKINVSELKEGFYLLKAIQDEKIFFQKIIVSKR